MLACVGAAALVAFAIAQEQNHDLGFKDTPMLPGLPWHVHDPDRPHPPVVTPGAKPGDPPSDAIILFDGKDMSQWKAHHSDITGHGGSDAPEWKVQDGMLVVTPDVGDLATKEKFGDCQLHVEWSEPPDVSGTSQGRGNSGVLLMSRFEVQVLDPWKNPTYADGQAGALYGQWPPLVNPGRPPGDWQVYDIVFTAPRFDGAKLLQPAYFTVFFNGVLVHNHEASMGPMVYRQVAHYSPMPAEDSLLLQNHHDAVRYRNIWIRRIHGQPRG
ncbi:MAG TPA: DUF1080 domain-containing protein [Bryobacteraceae bacterium]|nr:DUF1080 domain-containing protein [Bryobacteraceae bacterium]